MHYVSLPTWKNDGKADIQTRWDVEDSFERRAGGVAGEVCPSERLVVVLERRMVEELVLFVRDGLRVAAKSVMSQAALLHCGGGLTASRLVAGS
jgi:hypothetical protein